MLAQRAQALGDHIVIRERRARVAEHAEVLARVETRAGHESDAARRVTILVRTVCLGSVLDDRDVGAVRHGVPEPFHGRHLSVEMHGHDRTSARTDSRHHLFDIEEVGHRIAVDEPGVAPPRTTASAVATKVFVGMMTSSPGPTPRAAERQFECIRAVRNPHAVAHPDVVGVRVLELADLWPADEGTGVHDVLHRRGDLARQLGGLCAEVDELDAIVAHDPGGTRRVNGKLTSRRVG